MGDEVRKDLKILIVDDMVTMRRILKKIAQNETDDLGDTSTLADPSVIDSLLNK